MAGQLHRLIAGENTKTADRARAILRGRRSGLQPVSPGTHAQRAFGPGFLRAAAHHVCMSCLRRNGPILSRPNP